VGAACVIAAGLSLLATPAVALPRLDARFGEGGIARVPLKLWNPGGEFMGALRPIRQPDGKVLVPARVERYAGSYIAEQVGLARFTRRGAVDKAFGRRGRVLIGWNFSPATVSLQADGRILMVGSVSRIGAYSPRLAILRLLPDGSRDPAFGANGLVVWNPPQRAGSYWITAVPGLAVPQPDGRLLVAAHVDEGTSVMPRERVVLVRFEADGSLDQSFGQGGLAELAWDGGYFQGWARMADGRLASVASRNEGPGEQTVETQAWWLHRFTADGSSRAPLRSTGSVRLGLDVLDQLTDLVPTRDGALLMIGDVDVQRERGPATAVRRIRPNGSLDATYGRKCARPLLRAASRGAAPTRDGGALVTATRFLIRARPRRVDGLAIPLDATGCIADTPLHLRGLIVGPPLLQRGRSALLGATFSDKQGLAGGLALIKIRR
jgi:uncharacterized delta-60 repeat protein